MRNSILVRSIAAVSGIVMLASVAACGDNTASNTDSSASTDTKTTEAVSGNFSGAGASSQQAAVEAWIAGFQGTNPDAKVAYNPSGSGAGVSTFLTGATAWAGSDAALSNDEVEQSKSVCASGNAFDIPVYVSPIAVVFNLNGISGKGKTLNMDADTIAKIFDGKITSGVISTVQQADGTIGYADASQAGELGTVAVKVGDNYVPFSAEAAAKVVDASPLDESATGDNRVVVKLDHNTTEAGAYPIVLVSYDIACPAYKDANTAKFVKSWLTYVVSDEGQQTAASAAGSAPLSNTMRQKVLKSIDAIETK